MKKPTERLQTGGLGPARKRRFMRPRRTGGRLAALAALAGVLVFAVLVAPALVARHALRSALADLGFEAAGLETLSVRVWSGEAAFGPIELSAASGPSTHIGYARLRFAVRNLFRRRVEIAEAAVGDVAVAVHRTAGGALAIGGIPFDRLLAHDAAGTVEGGEPWGLGVGSLVVTDARVEIGTTGSGSAALDIERLTLRELRAWEPDRPAAVALLGRAADSALTLDGVVRYEGDAVSADLETVLPTADLARIARWLGAGADAEVRGTIGIQGRTTIRAGRNSELRLGMAGRVVASNVGIVRDRLDAGFARLEIDGDLDAAWQDAAPASFHGTATVEGTNGRVARPLSATTERLTIAFTDIGIGIDAAGLYARGTGAAYLRGVTVGVGPQSPSGPVASAGLVAGTFRDLDARHAGGRTRIDARLVATIENLEGRVPAGRGRHVRFSAAKGSLDLPGFRFGADTGFALHLDGATAADTIALVVRSGDGGPETRVRAATAVARGTAIGEGSALRADDLEISDLEADLTSDALALLLASGVSGSAAGTTNEGTGESLRVNRLRIAGSSVLRVFDGPDWSTPAVAIDIEKASLGPIDTRRMSPMAAVSLEAKVFGRSPLTVTGRVAPRLPVRDFELAGTLGDVPPRRLSRLVERTWGAALDARSASVAGTARAGGGDLFARLAVTLDEPSLVPLSPEEADALADRLGWPPGAILALLAGPTGRVVLPLTIEGRVGAPTVDLAGSIGTAVRAALAGLLPEGPAKPVGARLPLRSVPFAPGEASIGAAAEVIVGTLARLLVERPQVSVGVCGRVGAADGDASAEELATARTRAVIGALVRDERIAEDRVRACGEAAAADDGAPRAELSLFFARRAPAPSALSGWDRAALDLRD